MAKQKRKPANRQPITSHPLFPAVVALWFGALFGLGSLAIRPSLIENLVLSSRLDLIVPAAAPPLGITARIMIALIMAVVGATIGAVLARRLTRPKVEQKERNRGARDLAATSTPNRARDAHPDAPACTPISVRDLGEDVAQDNSANPLVGRRRALTVDHGEEQFMPHDYAPLPGGAPQILDLASKGPPMPAPEAPIAAAAPAPSVMPVAPLAAAPVDMQRQVFQPEPAQVQPAQIQPAVPICPDSAAAHADGRQVFGMEPAPLQEEKPRQIFGAAVEGDHVSQDFIREAGYRTTVFETETPAPLFERDPAAELAPVLPVAAPEPVTAPAAIPQAFEPAPAVAPEPQFEAAAAAQPAQPPLPSPGSLGMTDLASRLAESMRRRRAAKAGAAAMPAAAAEAPPLAAPVPEVFAPVPAAFEPAPPQFAPQAAAPAPVQFEAPVPAAFEPTPPQFEPQPAAPAPVQFEAPPAFAPAPAISSPVPSEYQAPAQPEEPVAVSPPPAELPNALRPLALDAFQEDDSPLDLGLLPSRHFAAPAPQPAAYAPPPEEPVEEAVAEENYASLLGITQPRTGFVRIEEPEADASAPEPVVIFPGQAAFGGAAAAPAPAAPFADDSGAFRRFDDPAAAGHGQPLAADMPTAAVDSGAADQALRSALANLQRMSGAA